MFIQLDEIDSEIKSINCSPKKSYNFDESFVYFFLLRKSARNANKEIMALEMHINPYLGFGL